MTQSELLLKLSDSCSGIEGVFEGVFAEVGLVRYGGGLGRIGGVGLNFTSVSLSTFLTKSKYCIVCVSSAACTSLLGCEGVLVGVALGSKRRFCSDVTLEDEGATDVGSESDVTTSFASLRFLPFLLNPIDDDVGRC